jgi:hypothetical protein
VFRAFNKLDRNTLSHKGILIWHMAIGLLQKTPHGFHGCAATCILTVSQAAGCRKIAYGGDSSKKFIMGGSAGGNLTACVGLHYASDENLRPIGMIVACMMSCDPRAMLSEYKKRYLPDNYMDTPMIDSKSVQVARGKTISILRECFWIFVFTPTPSRE